MDHRINSMESLVTTKLDVQVTLQRPFLFPPKIPRDLRRKNWPRRSLRIMMRTRTAIGTSRKLRLVTRRGPFGCGLWCGWASQDPKKPGFVTYPLVNIQKNYGKYGKSPFSIAMLNYQRVLTLLSTSKKFSQETGETTFNEEEYMTMVEFMQPGSEDRVMPQIRPLATHHDGSDNLAIAGCFGLIRSSKLLIIYIIIYTYIYNICKYIYIYIVPKSECKKYMGCVANFLCKLVQKGCPACVKLWVDGPARFAVRVFCWRVAYCKGNQATNPSKCWGGKWSKWIQMYIFYNYLTFAICILFNAAWYFQRLDEATLNFTAWHFPTCH